MPLHPRPAREPLAHTLSAHTHTKIVALLRVVLEEPAVGQVAAATGPRSLREHGVVPVTAPAAAVHWPPGEGCESKLRLPGAAPRGNGRSGVRTASTAPLGLGPRGPPRSPPITYSVELGGFHSEAETERTEKLSEAAAHPHSPCSGSKHGKPAPKPAPRPRGCRAAGLRPAVAP